MSLQNLTIGTIFRYCKRPVFKRNTGTYNSECPYCCEGSSSGKKRRFFYIPDEELLYCHNCGVSRTPLKFIEEMTHKTATEIIAESQDQVESLEDIVRKTEAFKRSNPYSLPFDSINLFDSSQINFFKENQVVKDAIEYIKKRRLDTAVNKPRSIWISLTDRIHKNRLVFPFYSVDKNAKVLFYQSRALYPLDEEIAKYLSKINDEKYVFNIDNVTNEIDTIFLQEGPIDAMFLKNSVALAGIHPTEYQLNIIKKHFPLHNLIYVLDNQWIDRKSYETTKNLLEYNQNVFIWPNGLHEYKDLNDISVKQKIDEIPYKFILKNTFNGVKGMLKYSQIKCKQN